MKYILLLGSNIGNKLKFINDSIELIEKRIGNVNKKSKMYKTEPWGFNSEEYFINIALEVESELNEEYVLENILRIEKEIGRKRNDHDGYQSREIDIDIIFAESKIIDSQNLKIPHPLMQERMFVLVPLVEIIPDFVHPVINKSIKKIKDDCSDNSKIFIFA